MTATELNLGNEIATAAAAMTASAKPWSEAADLARRLQASWAAGYHDPMKVLRCVAEFHGCGYIGHRFGYHGTPMHSLFVAAAKACGATHTAEYGWRLPA